MGILFVYSLFMIVQFGNFLAIELGPNQVYKFEYIFILLYLQLLKIPILWATSFSVQRALTGVGYIILSFCSAFNIIMAIIDFVSVITFAVEYPVCKSRYCYQEASGTGTVGDRTVQFYILLITTIMTFFMEILIVIAVSYVINRITNRNFIAMRNFQSMRDPRAAVPVGASLEDKVGFKKTSKFSKTGISPKTSTSSMRFIADDEFPEERNALVVYNTNHNIMGKIQDQSDAYEDVKGQDLHTIRFLDDLDSDLSTGDDQTMPAPLSSLSSRLVYGAK